MTTQAEVDAIRAEMQELSEGNRRFYLEYVLENPNTGEIVVCWRYNSYNRKRWDSPEVVREYHPKLA